jgi:hypothetical protein
MCDLEIFGVETRATVEANFPAEMCQSMRDETDVCWSGRNPGFKNDAQADWMDAKAAGSAVPFS